jgi:arylsulfatase A-like enzyme
MPFGLLKHPPFARHQREMVAELSAFARRPIGQRPATFRFVHFSIPHLPYVFGEEGFDPPFNPLETSRDDGYAAQVLYVDRLVGELMDDLKRAGAYDGTTIVVLADHGYRFGGRKRDPLQIPFIVKRAGQQSREEVRAERQGEVLLREILQDSCVAPGARP